MPAITIEGRTLSLDARRLWPVSGTIEYARVPRALWADRLRAAKQAGLNCIETPVIWTLHEPRPGTYKWDHDLDLPAFLRMVGDMGMHCVLRVGPYVGGGWELGGLPSWLPALCNRRLRGSDPAYLSACARWLSALADKVSDLQAAGSSRKRLGPIIAVRCEHRWFCGNANLGETSLRELVRYLREGGITVPVINTNNLYCSIEGTIDAWNDGDHLFASMRQLSALHPTQPSFATGVHVTNGIGGVWGSDDLDDERRTATLMARTLAECLAANAPFNLEPFHAGTNWGFSGGRTLGHLSEGLDGFARPTRDAGGASLGESGERGDVYHAVRRIATFCSTFERVLVALDGTAPAATIMPPALVERGTKSKTSSGGTASVVHLRGSQGSLAIVFGDGTPGQRVNVVLSDGSSLPVELGEHGIAWLLLDAHIVDRSTMDWCSLPAFMLVGRSLVLFGPAGASGMISVNGSAIELSIPKGNEKPRVVDHEGLALVLLNEEQVQATYATSDGVLIGVSEIDASGAPVLHESFKEITRIAGDGTMSRVQNAVGGASKSAAKVAITNWSSAPCDDYIDGRSERFAGIDKPASLEELGAASGYAWLRLKWRSSSSKKVRAGFVEMADRAHVYSGGSLIALAGDGPGAEGAIVPATTKSGENIWTILVDNLGRLAEGSNLGEHKGLWGHVWDLSPMRGTAKIEDGAPIDPLAWRSPLMGIDASDRTDSRRLTWRIAHRKQTPIALIVEPMEAEDVRHAALALVVVNDKPVRALTLSSSAGDRVLITADLLVRGNNTIQIAVVGDAEAALAAIKKSVTLHECSACLSEKAEWSFAKWDIPGKSAWNAIPKGSKSASTKGRAIWWRGQFTLTNTDRPLMFDASGLSKGQLFVNGHNVSRYWVATREGKAVAGQSRYYIPQSWLKTDGPNEVMLFDEHGFAPDRCSLSYR